MKNYAFCENCYQEVEYDVEEKQIESTIQNQTYRYKGKIAYCVCCHQEVMNHDLLDYNLKQPALFLSKNYQLNCGNYRKMIADIVLDPSDENFNKWVNYNLNMTDEQLFCLNNDIAKIKRLR